MILFDLNKSKNPDFSYWKHNEFDLDNMDDVECFSEFRFYKNDIYSLAETLEVPEKITTYNRSSFDGVESLCVFLKRFAYPCRYLDLTPRFGRPVPELCMMSNYIQDHIYDNYMHY